MESFTKLFGSLLVFVYHCFESDRDQRIPGASIEARASRSLFPGGSRDSSNHQRGLRSRIRLGIFRTFGALLMEAGQQRERRASEKAEREPVKARSQLDHTFGV